MPRPRLELVKQDYQPTQAELNETMVLWKKDGSLPTPEEVAKALVEPVDITYLDRPRHEAGLGTFLYNSLSIPLFCKEGQGEVEAFVAAPSHSAFLPLPPGEGRVREKACPDLDLG